jgi:hypothetical protein
MCNFVTRTAEPRRVKTDQNLQLSKASNALLVTWSLGGGGGGPSVASKHVIWRRLLFSKISAESTGAHF